MHYLRKTTVSIKEEYEPGFVSFSVAMKTKFIVGEMR